MFVHQLFWCWSGVIIVKHFYITATTLRFGGLHGIRVGGNPAGLRPCNTGKPARVGVQSHGRETHGFAIERVPELRGVDRPVRFFSRPLIIIKHKVATANKLITNMDFVL